MGSTLSVRSMSGEPSAFQDRTRIFVTPGGTFQVAVFRLGVAAIAAVPINGRVASPARMLRLFIFIRGLDSIVYELLISCPFEEY